ncbi:MAG TPA: SpoIIE family protein phosphatase [Vicinamibacterales bacterium]|nr:SpoIIE family protein phosphatase [Vicinamibacterales bacterium]
MSERVRVEPPQGPPFDCELQAPEVIIGRATTAGVVVPDSSMSRHHARLFQRDGRWWAEDLGTTNGTTLNDRPLVEATALDHGDRLRLGATVIRFDPDAGGATTDPGTLNRQAARLRTLNEIHRALATPISLSELLDLILERCFEVLRPEEGVILLKDTSGQFLPAATRRLPGKTGEVVVSRSLVEEVAGKGKPALVLDAALDDRFASSKSLIMSGVRSVVAAPLSDADGSIGMIALSSSVNVKQFADQDLEMLVSLASAAALRVRNVALAEEAAARKVLDRELSLAHDIQMAMLPRQQLERPEIDLAARLTPARSVGGDLYDFAVDGDRLWFIIADVSGKGVAAALYMAVAKTLFRASVRPDLGPADVLSRMNRELCRDNDQIVFVTAAVGHLSLTTGEVALGDAGHNPVLIVGPDGRSRTPKVPKCMALGVVADTPYTDGHFMLAAGEALVLYTDGATDARDRGGDMFDLDRLTNVIERCGGKSAEEIVAGISDAVGTFAAGAPPEDDLTLLVIRFLGRR